MSPKPQLHASHSCERNDGQSSTACEILGRRKEIEQRHNLTDLVAFPPAISNGQQRHMASIENGIPPFQCRTIWCWMSPGVNCHQEDERGDRITYCLPLNPRAPPKDMEKMMGILRNFAAPRRKSWTFYDWSKNFEFRDFPYKSLEHHF